MAADLSDESSSLSILETVLYVHDLAAAEDFYGRVLGLETVAAAAGRHVFYRCGNQDAIDLQSKRDAAATGS